MTNNTTPLQVQFGGQEGALTLEFAPAATPVGVHCSAIHLMLGALTAEITTVLGLDAVRVRNELTAALKSSDIAGATHFSSVEGDLQVRIELQHGRGTIIARVTRGFGLEDGYAEIRLTTDQTFMTDTARQLDALITTYPKLLELRL